MLVFDRGLGGDGWAGFSLLASLADDGDVWLENNHRGVMNGLLGAPGGHLVAQYPPGIVLLDAVPFFAGRILDSLIDRLLPSGWMADGADLPPAGRVPRGVFLSASLIVLARNAVTLLGLLWTALALRRLGLPERRTAAATALTFFGGPLIFYSLVGMTHAPTFALAALLLLLLVRQREADRPGLACAAGAVVGAAVLLRYSAVALLVPALFAVRGWRGRLAVLTGFAFLLLPLPFWWHACFGSWLPPPYGGRWVLTAASPWNVLFGPVHGLFLFHPALLCAAAGLVFGSSPLGGGGLEQGGGQEGGVANDHKRSISKALPEGGAPLLTSPLSQPPPSQGGGTHALGDRRAWGWIATVWFLSVAVLHGWWSESANPGGYGQRFLIDALPALALGFAGWLRPGFMRSVRLVLCLAAAVLGWLLFFAAVGVLVPPPPPWPWPQRLGEYAVLFRHPPGPAEIWAALRRASFLIRGLG
jgi:hypothetical protein